MPYEKIGKNDPVCIADEVPFEIPDSWEWCRLGDLFHTIMGQSPSGDTVSEHGNGMEFHQGKICFGDRYLKPSSQTTTAPTKVAPANSVLLCVRAPVGKVNITDREICIGRGLCSVVPLGGISVDFAYILLETYEDIFTKQATGTTFIAITGEVVKNQLVPVPPLAEQIRIINKIEKISPFVYEYGVKENQLSILNNTFPDSLKKSILQQAVMGKLVPQDPDDEPASVILERIRAEKQALIKSGKLKQDKHESIIYRRDNSHYEKINDQELCIDEEIPFDIPDTWVWARLGTVSTYAETKKKINAKDADPSLWGLDLEDIEKGGRLLIKHTVGERKAIGDKTFFEAGDILYSKLRPYLLKVLVADEDGICTPEIVPFKMFGSIEPSYIVAYLKSPYVDDTINAATYGIKMPRAGTETMTGLLVPIPPIAEQQRILEQIKRAFTFVSAL